MVDRADEQCLERMISAETFVEDSTGASGMLRAIEVLEADGPRIEMAAIAIDALIAAGRMNDAYALAAAILESCPDSEQPTAQLHRAMCWLMFTRGRYEDSLREADAALGEPGCSDVIFAEAKQMQLLALLASGRRELAREGIASVLLGNSSSRDAALPGILTILALLAWDSGQASEAIGLLRTAALREATQAPRSHARLYLAAMLVALGEQDEALEVIAEEEDRNDAETSSHLWTAAWPILRSRIALDAGNRNEAILLANTGLAIASDIDTPFVAPVAVSILATAAIRSGDLHHAMRLIDRCRLVPSMAPLGPTTLMSARARVIEACCGSDAALEVLEDNQDPLYITHILLADPSAAAWWVRAALQRRRNDQAAEISYCATNLASANPGIASLQAAAAHTGGLLRRQPELLQEAAETYPQRWARASAFEDAATILADCDWSAARKALDRAVVEYEAAGATRDAARTRLQRSRISGRPATGWASLTETEQNVVKHVIDGLTNAQVGRRMFLSRHTIDFHLRQVFRKLHINSRVELVRISLDSQHASL